MPEITDVLKIPQAKRVAASVRRRSPMDGIKAGLTEAELKFAAANLIARTKSGDKFSRVKAGQVQD